MEKLKWKAELRCLKGDGTIFKVGQFYDVIDGIIQNTNYKQDITYADIFELIEDMKPKYGFEIISMPATLKVEYTDNTSEMSECTIILKTREIIDFRLKDDMTKVMKRQYIEYFNGYSFVTAPVYTKDKTTLNEILHNIDAFWKEW